MGSRISGRTSQSRLAWCQGDRVRKDLAGFEQRSDMTFTLKGTPVSASTRWRPEAREEAPQQPGGLAQQRRSEDRLEQSERERGISEFLS